MLLCMGIYYMALKNIIDIQDLNSDLSYYFEELSINFHLAFLYGNNFTIFIEI